MWEGGTLDDALTIDPGTLTHAGASHGHEQGEGMVIASLVYRFLAYVTPPLQQPPLPLPARKKKTHTHNRLRKRASVWPRISSTCSWGRRRSCLRAKGSPGKQGRLPCGCVGQPSALTSRRITCASLQGPGGARGLLYTYFGI